MPRAAQIEPITRPSSHDVVHTRESRTLQARLEDAIERGQVELPVLPTVAFEVQRLIDGDAATSALVRAVEHEPTVAAALIRYANSALFTGLADIDDLQGAIGRLGRTKVRMTVMSLAAKAAFAGNRDHDFLYRMLWAHSMMTAIAARQLARMASVPEDTAFLAGLLHDIGKVVVLRGVSTIARQDSRLAVGPSELPALMDALHCAVGDALCRTWHIPDALRAAVTGHHRTDLTLPADTMAAVVQMADLTAAKIGASLAPNAELSLAEQPVARLLGLDEPALDALLRGVEDEYKTLSVIL